ncbi:paxillin homolog 1-like [Ptychodera flava]|uniref:paxillin homolog 1-like n=1 Tax=Ptychodera flava TaxID=63121 RepID=UPI00396A799F
MASVCFNCNQDAYGMVITALGHKWHAECFTCSQCGEDVSGQVFYRGKDDRPICEKDYKKANAPLCAGCKRPVIGDVVTALNSKWHMNCFVCAGCNRPFKQKQIYMNGGKPYCQEDFEKLFLGGRRRPERCHGCKERIVTQWVDAVGYAWHPQCFVCKDCKVPLQGDSCYKEGEDPYCAKCAMRAIKESADDE